MEYFELIKKLWLAALVLLASWLIYLPQTSIPVLAASAECPAGSVPTTVLSVVFCVPVASHVSTLAALQLTRTATYPNGVWRDDYGLGPTAKPIGAEPMFFVPETGTCAFNGFTNDNGSCVNTSVDGNSWVAKPANLRANVLQFGADKTCTADSTTPIQNAINSLSAHSGTVFFPTGCYLIATGPLLENIDGLTLQGENRQGTSEITAGTNDKSVLTMSGAHDMIRDMVAIGSNNTGTSKPTITIPKTTCSECEIYNTWIQYGSNNINGQGGEWYMFDSKVLFSYSTSMVYMAWGGGYLGRNKMDQTFYDGCNATASFGNTTISAWAQNTAYTQCQIVSDSGFLLQATNTAGSVISGSAPIPPTYDKTVAETGSCHGGSCVTWALLAPITYYAFDCDSLCGGDLLLYENDMTGPYSSSFAMTNTQTNVYTANTHSNMTVDNLNPPLSNVGSNLSGLAVGALITGTDIPANTTITAINIAGNSFTISNNASGTHTGVTETVELIPPSLISLIANLMADNTGCLAGNCSNPAGNLLLAAGNGVQASGNVFAGCLISGCAGVNIIGATYTGFTGDAMLDGNYIWVVSNGIVVQGSQSINISGNVFGAGVGGGSTAGVILDNTNTASCTAFAECTIGVVITANNFSSSVHGAVGTGVGVTTNGTNSTDYYTITGNDFNGVGTPVNDGIMSAHNLIENINGTAQINGVAEITGTCTPAATFHTINGRVTHC